jgi:ADP-ribose pyrophosphatase
LCSIGDGFTEDLDKISKGIECMSRLLDYISFARSHSELFVNPPQANFTIILDENEIRKVEKQVAQRCSAQGLPTEWAEVGIVYQDPYILFLHDAVRLPNGVVDIYVRFVESGGTPGIVVLPVHQGNVRLIRHFRHKLRDWQLEIPQGLGMEGLNGEENARKELEEEIGASISKIIPLGKIHLDANSIFGYIELFFAKVDAYGDVEVKEGITELLSIPIPEFERMIWNNDISNIFILAAYTKAKLHNLL